MLWDSLRFTVLGSPADTTPESAHRTSIVCRQGVNLWRRDLFTPPIAVAADRMSPDSVSPDPVSPVIIIAFPRLITGIPITAGAATTWSILTLTTSVPVITGLRSTGISGSPITVIAGRGTTRDRRCSIGTRISLGRDRIRYRCEPSNHRRFLFAREAISSPGSSGKSGRSDSTCITRGTDRNTTNRIRDGLGLSCRNEPSKQQGGGFE